MNQCLKNSLAPPRTSGYKCLSFATETQVVRKNRSAGVSPASEPRQLLLGQHDLCRLEAGDTFFLTTTETRRSLRVSVAEDLTVKNHKVLLTNAVYPWLFEREVRTLLKTRHAVYLHSYGRIRQPVSR